MSHVNSDETRPTCQRCRNGFFSCGGYTGDWVFRHDGTWLRSPGKAVELPDQDCNTPIGGNSGTLTFCCFHPSPGPESATPSSGRPLAVTPMSRQLALPSVSSLPSTISLDAFKDEIVISHFLNKMFLDVRSVVHVLPNLREDRHSTKYFSLLALSVGFFARVHNDIALQRNGDRIYGQALYRLINDMRNRRSVDWYSNAISPLCLCVYELIRASGPFTWLQHSSGIAAVVGPISSRPYRLRRRG